MHIAQAQALMLADVVVIGQAPANRPLRDLDMRRQLAAVKHRVTEARAQGDDHFETASRNGPSAGDFGVVQDLGGQAEGRFDRRPMSKWSHRSTSSGNTRERGPSRVM